jgi:periplasmic mercuric ion binding protein
MKKITRTLALAFGLSMVSIPAFADQVVEVDVNGMACEFCAYGLQGTLSELDGATEAEVSLGLQLARIVFEDDTPIDEEQIRQAVLDAGFTPTEVRVVETDG